MDNLIRLATSLTDYESVRDFLYGLRYHGAKYGLERMIAFADALGNPQEKLSCIHVAGTNGKGSTCSMIEAIYRSHGYRTGLYSSPHLIRQGERIQVNRNILNEEEIVAYAKRMITSYLNKYGNDSDLFPSFFEFMTAMGFLKFNDDNVDVAVIETGLGGRLDATNVLNPLVSIITSISLDHTAILGEDIETIASEKAGIIKPGVPLVIGWVPEAAEKVLRGYADKCGSRVYSIREKWGDDIAAFPKTNLRGPHQQMNAAMALLAVELLREHFPVKDNLSLSALEQIDWPGRWEELQFSEGTQRVILDSSHNEEGAKMLEVNLKALVEESESNPIIVTGSLGDDRARQLLNVLVKYTDELILVQPHQPRALSTGEMKSCVPSSYEGSIREASVEDLFGFQETTIASKLGQTILVTGSIYLIGEISDLIKSNKKIDQQDLQDVV